VPELPDVEVYVERLRAFTEGEVLERVRLGNAFVVRTFEPPISELSGKRIVGIERLGKRVVFAFENDHFLVIHLMIAGRLRWKEKGIVVPKKVGHAAFDFPKGTLLFTEASTKKRASIHVVRGRAALGEHNRGGVEPLVVDRAGFEAALLRERRTMKRALTDPRIFSGIGNAYSDEMLFWAQLSPVRLTTSLDQEEIDRLYVACRQTLIEWTRRLRTEVGEGFPDRVTAFREEMAVHGRYGQPCRVCGGKVQRIRYAENEVNYCPHCQTEGKLLADRSLSRLLHGDWPKSLEELEEFKEQRRG
jgi:formamidopyrimidine-DNA glycosylase